MIEIKRVANARELAQAFAVRLRVFVDKQAVPADIELDRDDRRALHLIARVAGKVVGTARIVMRGRKAKIGRMAVLKRFRGRGIGTQLLNRAIAAATELGAAEIYLHAQVAVIGFYEKLHFRCIGPAFDEAGIAHRKMILRKTKRVGRMATARKKRKARVRS